MPQNRLMSLKNLEEFKKFITEGADAANCGVYFSHITEANEASFYVEFFAELWMEPKRFWFQVPLEPTDS